MFISANRAFIVGTLVLLLGACSGQQRRATEPAPRPEPVEVTPDTHRTHAPMSLKLAARLLKDQGGLVELTATLSVAGRLPGPPVLRIKLPEGANLTEGEPEETLDLQNKELASVTRIFRITGAGQGEVEVSASSTAEGAGAQAVAYYPERKPPAATAPIEKRAIPRTKIGGETVDRAVPIN
jgi:hypothetical protein